MNALPVTRDGDPHIDPLAAALASPGYAVLDGFVPTTLCEGLLAAASELGEAAFARAGVGRALDHEVNRFVRRDRICWLTGNDPRVASYLAWISALRRALNGRLFLGLFDYECHFARYAPGDFYRTHVDAFRGGSNRVLSTVLYLNPAWTGADGGQLVLYGADRRRELARVLPTFGRLVTFLSEEFPHEVLPANRTRLSVAGWFRVNATVDRRADPPR